MNKKLLLFLVLVLGIQVSSCDWMQEETEPTIYYIPSSLRGQVTIVYNYEKGESPKFKRGKLFFEIPENGQFYTQVEPSYGLALEEEFYLVSEDGKKKEIVINVNTESDTSICIYNNVTGSLTINKVEYPYEAFMICRKDSIKYHYDFDLQLDAP